MKDKTTKDQVLQRIDRICDDENFGNFKRLEENLFELKFSNGVRIYYTKISNKIVLLLCAGNKSRQGEDIKKAKKYLKDYESK